MTAEVAVMNKQAIALAADSAVTFGRDKEQKIFTSASKIFTLSKYEPVGVMIYGDANLMEVPWETIIKVYRNNLGQKTFKTVRDYAKDFLSFVVEEQQLLSNEAQNRYVERSIFSYFLFIAEEITNNIVEVIEKGEIDEAAIQEITSRVVKKHFEKWKKTKPISSVPDGFMGILRQKYRNLIIKLKKNVFQNLKLTSHSSRQLTEIALNLFTKFPTGLTASNHSGIVIAGFGTEDVFPSLESFSVEGKIGNYLKYKKNETQSTEISLQNKASIIPFAQSEMVATFMEGVDPNYHNAIEADIKKLCISYPQVLADKIDCLDEKERKALKNHWKEIGQQEFNKYTEKLTNYRGKHHVLPIINVVEGLPKDELAAMAESLINLTSFKRRVSMQVETVGGPIDVAVISKGDGFVWIKRKHYFTSELNQQFFANYYKEVDINGTKTLEKAD